MIYSVASLTKFVMFLFSFYKTRALIRLPWLVLVNVLGMTTKGKYVTVNSVYGVPNCKYDHLSYPHLLSFISCYYEYKTHTTVFF
jgi:hypothetical protein